MHNISGKPRSAKAIRLMLDELGRLGYKEEAFIEETDIDQAVLADISGEITVGQELAFLTNVLAKTEHPAIGLMLGRVFSPQSYGMFGYALLSASTLQEVFTIAASYGQLSFSFFSFECQIGDAFSELRLTQAPCFEEPISRLLCDRDLSAIAVSLNTLSGHRIPLEEVHLTHDGAHAIDVYQNHFDCNIVTNATQAKVVLNNQYATKLLPNRNPIAAEQFIDRCKCLLAQLSDKSHFIDLVRMEVLRKPGHIPDIAMISSNLAISSRTLRRRLKDEGSSYTEIVNEIRYQLAREYLTETELPLNEIARMLGYTESGNFTHAFKRWSGVAPASYRLSPTQ